MTFFDAVQKELHEMATKKFDEEMARRIREEEERLDAAVAATVAAPVSDAAKGLEWVCSTCTYINGGADLRCQMCDTPCPTPLSTLPLDEEPVVYFELTVLGLGKRGAIGIGICIEGYRRNAMPGWDVGAYGWSDDTFFSPQPQTSLTPPFADISFLCSPLQARG